LTLILQNHYIITVNESLHNFKKSIVETQTWNQLYRVVPVGSYKKDSTGTLDYTKTTLTKLLHCSKRIYTFTKFQKRNMKHLGNYIDEVLKPHLSFYYSKTKKILNVLVWILSHSSFTIPVRKCMF
jgi:hypothetical protein